MDTLSITDPLRSVLDDLKRIVDINSHTHNKEGVDRVGQRFEGWLRPLGFDLTRHPRTDIGDHLLFHSRRGEGQRLLLLGHLDTVFAPGTFEGLREDDEWVHGPGVCDMKGGLMVALEGLRRVHRHRGSLQNIDFLLVSDEESGSDDSKFLTAATARDYDVCLVFEAAGREGELVAGRKGVGTFTVDIEGRAAHAGNCHAQGIDANREAARLLLALGGLTDLTKGSTANVGRMRGGISANTISPQAWLMFEIRYVCAGERDRLLSAIDRLLPAHSNGCTLKRGGGIQRDVMEPTADQQRLLTAIRNVTGRELPTESRGGVSDANITSSSGLTTLDGFGPFGDGDHTHHERAAKASFRQRIELVTAIFEHHQKTKNLY